MEWLWLWGGSTFGYREIGELRTHDGRHAGRFLGDEVYGADGLYLGELMYGNRLITNPAKKSQRVAGFSRLPDNARRHPVVGFNSFALPPGYQDFPRPARFQ